MPNLFPNHPKLETERFVLTATEEHEIPSLLELSWWQGKPVATLEQARETFAKVAEQYALGRCYHWQIRAKDISAVVGSVGYYRGFENAQGEVGYVMRADFQGRRIMTEVLPAVLAYGFEAKGLSRIIAVTKPDNVPSVALLARFGFLPESEREDGYRIYALQKP
jgi:ribosomal-protein-alanine N-acetyltransferase